MMNLIGKTIKDVRETDYYCYILFNDGTDYLIETRNPQEGEVVLEYKRDVNEMSDPAFENGKKTYRLHTDVGTYEYLATGPENAKSQFRDEVGYNFIKIHSVKEV